jgi:hypothetical protein
MGYKPRASGTALMNLRFKHGEILRTHIGARGVDCFVQEGKLFGYRDRYAVIPEQIILPPAVFEALPLGEMRLLFRGR